MNADRNQMPDRNLDKTLNFDDDLMISHMSYKSDDDDDQKLLTSFS